MRRLNSIVLILFFITAPSFSTKRKQDYKIRTIVIDAGHGGHDSGCLGASAKEKNIALAVALKLGKQIEDNFPDVRVIFTRKTDVFIPLHERAAIANRNKADLFICIHCNSGGNKSAFGVETYVMGLHKTEENLTVARRENASVLLEEDYKTQYEGFDPNSPEANIIFNLYQNQYLNQSLEFASNVQDQVVEYAGRHNRGVRQAGFLVLYKTAMPSVLIETGFLTHDMEEKYLLSDKGQTNLATCIYRAFKSYKIDTETSSITPSIKKENRTSEDDASPIIVAPTTVKKEPIVIEENKKDNVTPITIAESKNSIDTVVLRKVEPLKKEIKPIVVVADTNTVNSNTKAVEKNVEKKINLYYTVQIGASAHPEKDGSQYSHVSGVQSIAAADGFTRYVVGKFTTLETANKRKDELKSQGFKDCFLSAYNGDKRITVVEATELFKKK